MGSVARSVRSALQREESSPNLTQALEFTRLALQFDRISVHILEAGLGEFRVVASAGIRLLYNGTQLPCEASTQITAAMRGETFLARNFADPVLGFSRPLDALIVQMGFGAGCALPLQLGSRTVGVICVTNRDGDSISDVAIAELHSVSDVLTTVDYAWLPAILPHGQNATATDLTPDPTPPFVHRETRRGEGTAFSPQQHLTEQERRLLGLLETGATFRHIAMTMHIRESTCKGYARSLFEKLGVHSRGEAVYRARQRGQLPLG